MTARRNKLPAPKPVITPELLEAATDCSGARAELWAPSIAAAAARYGIDTSLRVAAWLAQIAHESARFACVVENLNYSAEGLQRIFPRHFPTDDLAQKYARKPGPIASRVYANRLGNGDEASMDGWTYRGRGLIQITGRGNYLACGKALGLPLVSNPELLLTPSHAAMSAAWFWDARGLNAVADLGEIERVTRLVNGGLHGLADRVAIYTRARSVFA